MQEIFERLKEVKPFDRGIILEEYLTEMATVGNFGKLQAFVRTNDAGKIPHFHIWDATSRGTDKKKGFHTCVRIDKCEYFLHEGKMDTIDDKDDREALVDFLKSKSKNKRFSEFTNWQVLVALWNMNNSDVEIDEDIEMPNYMNLKRPFKGRKG